MSLISPINKLFPITPESPWYQPRVALMGITSDARSVFYVIAFNLPYSTAAPLITFLQQPNIADPGSTDNPECLFLQYDGDLPDVAPPQQMTCVFGYQWMNPATIADPDPSNPNGQIFAPVYLKVKDKPHKGTVKTGIGAKIPTIPTNTPLYQCNTFIVAPIMPNGGSQIYYLGSLANILESDQVWSYTAPPDQTQIMVTVANNSLQPVSTKCMAVNVPMQGELYPTPVVNVPATIQIFYSDPSIQPPVSNFDYNPHQLIVL